jgi:hypothetical protein
VLREFGLPSRAGRFDAVGPSTAFHFSISPVYQISISVDCRFAPIARWRLYLHAVPQWGQMNWSSS